MHDVPENLLYSKDHEWIEIDGDIGTIGISDHAQAELSDVVFVDDVANIPCSRFINKAVC